MTADLKALSNLHHSQPAGKAVLLGYWTVATACNFKAPLSPEIDYLLDQIGHHGH